MKTCGHEYVTVPDCDTCYIVKLKKRVDKLIAANHYNVLHREKLVAENLRLRDCLVEAADSFQCAANGGGVDFYREAKCIRDLLGGIK